MGDQTYDPLYPNGVLLGPDGRPLHEPSMRSSLLTPTGKDYYSQIYKNFYYLPNVDDIVQKKGLAAYREMLTDVEVKNAVDSKRYEVCACTWQLVPATQRNQDDIDIARFVEWNLNEMTGDIGDVIFEALAGIVYGFSVAEMLFKICEAGEYRGLYVLDRIKAKNPENYEFKCDEYANIQFLMLRTLENMLGAPVPREKYCIYVHNPQNGWPHGVSDLRKVYKHWWSKDFLLKWWNIYLEKYGIPTAVASYPRDKYPVDAGGDNASVNKLMDILNDIIRDTNLVLPDDIKVDFREIAMGGSIAFRQAIGYHDDQIKTGILGEILTSGTAKNASGGGGSYALGKEHGETKETYVARLRNSISQQFFYEQVIKTLVRINFPGVRRYPQFILVPRMARFQQLMAQDIQVLYQVGILTTDDNNIIREKLGLPPQAAEAAQRQIQTGDPAATEKAIKSADGLPAAHARCDHAAQMLPTGTFRREPNKYEKRVDFGRMQRDINDTNDALMKSLSAIVEKWKTKMLAYLPNRAFNVDGTVNTKNVMGLKLMGVPEFADTLRAALKDVAEKQSEIAYSEIDNGALRKHAMRDWNEDDDIDKFARVVMGTNVIPAQEIAKIKQWRADGNWRAIKGWRAANAAKLSGNIDAQTFWITDVVKNDILTGVKGAIMNGVASGASIPQMVKNAGSVFENYIARGELENTAMANAPRLESIVRTNVQRAYVEARVDAFREGAAAADWPAMEFSALMENTCDLCMSLDGNIYPADDPIWDQLPLHNLCGCVPVSVYKDDVPEKWSPAPDMAAIQERKWGKQGAE